jgi:F420-dependent methylenetetrahydromethanopterin dehydrogenase
MVVTSVREGVADMPFHGGVGREVSTKVIVVAVTGAELAAPAAALPTAARSVAKSRMTQATATSKTLWRVAPNCASLRPKVMVPQT